MTMYLDGICEDTVIECEKVNTILEVFMEGLCQDFEILAYPSTPIHDHDFTDVPDTPGAINCAGCGMFIRDVFPLTV
jgi:hypothetical protein